MLPTAPSSLSLGDESRKPRFWHWFAASSAIWAVMAVTVVTQGHFRDVQRGLVGPNDFSHWLQLLRQWSPRYLVWAALSPPIFFLAQRYLIRRGPALRHVLLHIGLGLAFALLGAGLHSIVICMFWPHPSLWDHLQRMLLSNSVEGIVTYGVVLLAAHAWAFRQEASAREISAFRLTAQLKGAELATLRLQLNPHFLFNSLNTLATLMREDQRAAERLLNRLSAFLRAVLADSERETTTLKQELELLSHYVAVEKARFEERLSFSSEIEAAAADAMVPRLILQPLVENAVRHAVANRSSGGEIHVSGAIRNRHLQLSIRDNGPGWAAQGKSPVDSDMLAKTAADTEASNGIGLRNTRQRLERLFGADQRMELLDAENGGAMVLLTLPLSSHVRIGSSGS